MPSAQEYRYQAEECLELAKEAKEVYVQSALVELAREFIEKARELEKSDDQADVDMRTLAEKLAGDALEA
jgi:hypothetical protein